MSVAYQMSMPILIINLGVEMIYVLCSRLKAQNIPNDKSSKVINDVVISLFDKKFMTEIRKKQNLSPHQSVRQLFDKLAHSSIMRLNTTSMNKLFDLMLMSIKLQLCRIKFPEEILQVTLNHLNALNEILNGFDSTPNTEPKMCVKENIDFVNKVYTKLSPYDYIVLRQILLRFFQGKNVKVSLFIQECLQSNTGVIYLPMIDMAPPHVDIPGKIIYYDNLGEIIKNENLSLTLSHDFMISNSEDRINCITTALGGNFYSGDKKVFTTFVNKESTLPKPDSLKINNNIDSFVKPVIKEDNKSKENETPHAFDNFGIISENKLHINNNLDKILTNKDNEKTKLEPKVEDKINTNIQNPNVVSSSANFNITSSSNSQNQVVSNPNNVINQNFNKQSYLENTEIRKKNIEVTKKEFNDLADFLNIKSSDDKASSGNSGQVFKIDLFSNNNKKSNSNKNNDKDDDYDIIEIERDNNANINKVKNMFDDFDLNDNQEQDDLLELMDIACKK